MQLHPDIVWNILEFCKISTICNICIAERFLPTIKKYLQHIDANEHISSDIYYKIALLAISGKTDYNIELFDMYICTDDLLYNHTLSIVLRADYMFRILLSAIILI